MNTERCLTQYKPNPLHPSQHQPAQTPGSVVADICDPDEDVCGDTAGRHGALQHWHSCPAGACDAAGESQNLSSDRTVLWFNKTHLYVSLLLQKLSSIKADCHGGGNTERVSGGGQTFDLEKEKCINVSSSKRSGEIVERV